MALTNNERSPDLLQITRDAIQAELANFWTCLPCEVVKYDPEAVTVDVQSTIKIPINLPSGEIELVELPMFLDVPVMFPCAGGFTITHPIKQGDECLVSFADRNIDVWWQQGGIQNPFDTRKHDLSDGFAFFKPQSQAKKISGISATDLEIRNDKNTCKIQITPDGVINFIGTKSVFHHPVEMRKTLNVDETIDAQGVIKSKSDVVASAISLKTHQQTGVQPGSGTSGPPK